MVRLEINKNSDDWTFDEFGDKLVKRFSRLSSKLNLRREFETRVQRNGERAKSFLQELKYLATKLDDAVSDDLLMYRFITGLRPSLRDKACR